MAAKNERTIDNLIGHIITVTANKFHTPPNEHQVTIVTSCQCEDKGWGDRSCATCQNDFFYIKRADGTEKWEVIGGQKPCYRNGDGRRAKWGTI